MDELPSARQLLRSTLVALIAAVVILLTIVLPAEYAVDPTGVGRMLGLTEMGEIKARLAEEAAIDAAMASASVPAAAPPDVTPDADDATVAAGQPAPAPAAAEGWRDEMQVLLAPGQGAEIKLAMTAGAQAAFSWSVQGGVVNFDTHGDGGGRSISYEKGRGVASDDGVLEAAFDGNHGWFWRNRGASDVTVTLRTRGDYASIKRAI